MTNTNEPPKSIWKKPRRGSKALIIWGSLLGCAAFAVAFGIGILGRLPAKDAAKFGALFGIVAFLCPMVAVGIKWICDGRNHRRVILGFVGLVMLIVLAYVEEDLRGKWAWNRFKQECEAKGEKFDITIFTPPPVPDDQNFALAPIMFSTYGSMIDKTGHEINPRNTNVASRLELNLYRSNDYGVALSNGNWAVQSLTDLKPWQTYYRTASTNAAGVITNEFPISAQAQSPPEDVLLALSKYDSVVEELREASRMPYSRFPLEYDKDNPAMILLPHLAALKRSAEFLQLRAIAELQAGKTEAAAADVGLMCYLINAPQSERFLITHLVRMVMLNFTIQPIYEGFAAHRWSDAQLTGIGTALGKIDFLADYQHSMQSEAAVTPKMIEYIRRTREISPFLRMFAVDGHEFDFRAWDLACRMAPSGWFYENEIRSSEFYLRQCVPVVNLNQRTVSTKAASVAQAKLDAAIANPNPYNALQYVFNLPTKRWISEKNVIADKFAHAQTCADLARLAIALERHRLAHGEYPETLEPLTPQFMPALPHDVITSQPLHYRRTTDGNFALYSVGWNETDDGGSVALSLGSTPNVDITQGDWVWKYPEK